MNREQEQQIIGYYGTADKYIRSEPCADAHQTVFTKENDNRQRLVLVQASQNHAEVRLTDKHGTTTARDTYDVTRNIPKCVRVERFSRDADRQILFNADEINLIYQFGEQTKSETCAGLSAIIPLIKDHDTKQIASTTLNKLNSLPEGTCEELTATTKRRKLAERDHSIRARLAKSKEQAKQPPAAEGKRHRTHSRGKGHMEL